MSRYYFAKAPEINEFFERHVPCPVEEVMFITRIKKIVINNYPKKLSIIEICREFNRSPRWLQVKCKKAFNINYTRLIRSLRIYSALRMLHETNIHILEIALELKYPELSSMTHDFEKELNFCPSTARKKLLTLSPDELFATHWQT